MARSVPLPLAALLVLASTSASTIAAQEESPFVAAARSAREQRERYQRLSQEETEQLEKRLDQPLRHVATLDLATARRLRSLTAIVQISTTWCFPCKKQKLWIEERYERSPGPPYFELDIDSDGAQEILRAAGIELRADDIQVVPTTVILNAGSAPVELRGFDPEELERALMAAAPDIQP